MASNKKPRTALIFGASGITGWAIMRESLEWHQVEFARIIGLTNRPLEVYPFSSAQGKLSLVSGMDLTAGVDAVTSMLGVVAGIDDVTDVFFAAYIQPPGTSDIEGHEELKRVNVAILETAVQAVEAVCPRLRFWSLQTGGKAYGFVHADRIGLPKVPCRESDPRIPSPYAEQLFYYAQYDILARLSAGKSWKFAEIRPDGIIGFVPGGNNAMNIAQALCLFLSFYKESGVKKVPFPGTTASYTARHTDVGQRTLGRAHLHCSNLALKPQTLNGEIYNVGDTGLTRGTSWDEKWPALCRLFNFEGVGPEEGDVEELRAGEYMRGHRSEWKAFEAERALKPGVLESTSWDFMDIILERAVFDRQYDLRTLVKTGFDERQDIMEVYTEVIAAMRATKILP